MGSRHWRAILLCLAGFAGQAYAEGQGVNSIPRNWIVSQDGKIRFEGIGFDYDGEQWLKRAVQMIDKAKSTP